MAEKDIKLEELFRFCKNKAKGKCPVHGCRNLSRPHGRLCGTHHTLAWRLRNPIRQAWQLLRMHAKRRGKAFDIPFEAFEEICRATGYVERKGQRPQDLSIDRIDHRKGYVLSNIRVVTVSVNSTKGAFEGRINLSSKQSVEWETISVEQYIRREEERVAKHDPWAAKALADKRNKVCEEKPKEPELPRWLRDDEDDNEPF